MVEVRSEGGSELPRPRHLNPLVVVTPSRSVAEWARAPIDMGTGSVFRVLVLGPDEIPRPASPDESPERILS
ncbi:MAG: hypothetical protein AAFU79_28455, partial [Myxococcota bacterium]